jgi:hypothetical protein
MRRAVALTVLIVAAAACTSMQSQYAVRRNNLTCDQANRYAFRSMKSLGYTVTTFEPAAVGRAGVLRGSKAEEGTSGHDGIVHIACDPPRSSRRGGGAAAQSGPDVHARVLSRVHGHRRPRHDRCGLRR